MVNADGSRLVKADIRQAEYFLGVLGQESAEIGELLVHHRAELAVYEHAGDLAGVRRKKRVVRALEQEALEIEQMVRALWKTVAPSTSVGAEGIGPPTADV